MCSCVITLMIEDILVFLISKLRNQRKLCRILCRASWNVNKQANVKEFAGIQFNRLIITNSGCDQSLASFAKFQKDFSILKLNFEKIWSLRFTEKTRLEKTFLNFPLFRTLKTFWKEIYHILLLHISSDSTKHFKIFLHFLLVLYFSNKLRTSFILHQIR